MSRNEQFFWTHNCRVVLVFKRAVDYVHEGIVLHPATISERVYVCPVGPSVISLRF